MVENEHAYSTQICRSCLSTSEEMYPLFTQIDTLECDVASILTQLSLEVKQDKHYPDLLCASCFNSIIIFYNFCETFKASQQVLDRRYLQFSDNGTLKGNDVIFVDIPFNNSDQKLMDTNKVHDSFLSNLLHLGDVKAESDVDLVAEDVGFIKFGLGQCREETLHNCPICKKSFKSFRVFIKHLKKYDNIMRSMLCDVCEEQFKNVYDYVNHYKNFHKYKEVIPVKNLTIIEEDSEEVEEITINVTNDTTNVYRNICPICSNSYKNTRQFLKHVKSHKFLEITCNLCLEMFNNSTSFVDHFLCKHGENRELTKNDKTKYICPVCVNKPLNSFQSFSRHVLNHPKVITCNFCHKEYENSRIYLEHYQEKHRNQCDICDTSFDRNDLLQRHLKEHDESYDPTFVCPIENCGRRFYTSSSLVRHGFKHDNRPSFVCKICGDKFTTYDAMRYHSKKHKGPSHLCMYCGRAFMQAIHLTYHMWRHTGIKPYQCKECGKSFVKKKLLNNHKEKCIKNEVIQSELKFIAS